MFNNIRECTSGPTLARAVAIIGDSLSIKTSTVLKSKALFLYPDS